MRCLAYIIAFDVSEPFSHAKMAKMLVSSLLRTYFSGDIIVYRNTAEPLFKVQRKGLEEIFIAPELTGTAHGLKYLLRDHVQEYLFPDGPGNPAAYDSVCFLDCDMLALRGIDHLLTGDNWDILWTPDPRAKVVDRFHNAYLTPDEMKSLNYLPGANSGSWAVKAEHYYQVMTEWQEIDESGPLREKRGSDQPAWNRVLLNTSLRKRKFEKDEIMFPTLGASHADCDEAALLHVPGAPQLKLRCLAGYFYGRFFADQQGLFLNILEP